MSSATLEAAEAVLAVPVDQVFVSKLNTRQPKAADVQELVESIRHAGQIAPCIVRPHPDKPGCYELAAGARRRTACAVLEIPVKIIVREMDDAEFEDAILIENLQREDPDPMAEARLIGRRLEEGVVPSEIAAKYGKSERWVQRRIKLLSLIPSAVKAAQEGEMAHFNTEMLEYVGSLPEDVQTQLLGERWVMRNAGTLAELKDEMGRMKCSLKGAGKWLKDPATFVDGCGPGCATDSQGGLFPEEGKGACGNCLRPACFRKREALAVDAAIKKALGEDPISKVIVFRREGYGDVRYQGKELKVMRNWELTENYEIVKEAKEGVVIGIDVTKPHAAARAYLQPKKKSGGGKSTASGSGVNAGPKESREDKLTGKRLASMQEKLVVAVQKAPVPATASILCIAAAFGMSRKEEFVYCGSEPWKVIDYAGDDADARFIAAIWKDVQPVLRSRLGFQRNLDLLDKRRRTEMERIAGLIGFDYAGTWQTICTVEVPVPKSWGAGIDPLTLKAAKVAKAAPAAKKVAKKAVKKVAKKAAKKTAKAGGKAGK